MKPHRSIASTSNLSFIHLAKHRHSLGYGSETRGRSLSLQECSTPSGPGTRPCTQKATYVTAASTTQGHRTTLKSSRRGQQPPALGLGLRTSKPPDTFPAPADPYDLKYTENDPEPGKNGDEKCEEVSDQEWELRTGRAIYVLQETLPTFFHTGLIASIDATTGAPKVPNSTSSHHHHSSTFHIPIIDSAASLDFLSSSASPDGTANGKGKAKHHANNIEKPSTKEDEEVPIYSPNVRLQYEPPIVLPAPFPKTFKLEGIQMYLASSSLLRHTMNTLYSDLEVTLTKVSVHNEPPTPDNGGEPPSEGDGTSTGATATAVRRTRTATISPSSADSVLAVALEPSSPFPSVRSPPPLSSASGNDNAQSDSDRGAATATTTSRKHSSPPSLVSKDKDNLEKKRNTDKKRLNREKYLLVRQLVTGTNRVSGKVGEWEVESLYAFSPLSGLILKHTVNSIQPAPHIAVYDSLKMSLGKMFGFGGGHPVGEGGGAAAPTAASAASASAASMVHPDHGRKGM